LFQSDAAKVGEGWGKWPIPQPRYPALQRAGAAGFLHFSCSSFIVRPRAGIICKESNPTSSAAVDDAWGTRRDNIGQPEITMSMKNPPHPGDFIKTEIVEAYGLSVTAAAQALGVSRPTLSSLLNSKAGLSGDMAPRIEKAFGVKMDTLMRMQSAYEIAQTRKREKLIRVRRVVCAA
jgi:addiction module HigA family antidote